MLAMVIMILKTSRNVHDSYKSFARSIIINNSKFGIGLGRIETKVSRAKLATAKNMLRAALRLTSHELR